MRSIKRGESSACCHFFFFLVVVFQKVNKTLNLPQHLLSHDLMNSLSSFFMGSREPNGYQGLVLEFEHLILGYTTWILWQKIWKANKKDGPKATRCQRWFHQTLVKLLPAAHCMALHQSGTWLCAIFLNRFTWSEHNWMLPFGAKFTRHAL